MSSVDVRYALTSADDAEWKAPIARDWLSILPPWALNDGEETARAVAVEHMRDVWADHVGDDDDCTVLIRITAPAEIAGTYEVELSKKIFGANVRKLEAA